MIGITYFLDHKGNDPLELEFETTYGLIQNIRENCNRQNVFLMTKPEYLSNDWEEYPETFVTSNIETIIKVLEDGIYEFNDERTNNITIQCYESFESAYSVALSLKEVSLYCYDESYKMN